MTTDNDLKGNENDYINSEQGLKSLGVECNLQIMTPQDSIIGFVKILLDVRIYQ